MAKSKKEFAKLLDSLRIILAPLPGTQDSATVEKGQRTVYQENCREDEGNFLCKRPSGSRPSPEKAALPSPLRNCGPLSR